MEAARKLTESFYTAAWIKNTIDGRLRHFAFLLLEDDVPAAFDGAQATLELAKSQKVDAASMVYHQLHVALLARELKKNEVEQSAVAEVQRLLDEEFRNKYVEFSAVTDAVCKVLAGETLDD